MTEEKFIKANASTRKKSQKNMVTYLQKDNKDKIIKEI